MKRRSNKFLALCLAAVLSVTPVISVTAQEAVPDSPGQAIVQQEETTEAAAGEDTTDQMEEEATGTMPDEAETPESDDAISGNEPGDEETEDADSDDTSENDTANDNEAEEETTDGDVDGSDTVSENTVSGNAISSNAASENETDALFPGLPEGYGFSASAKKQRTALIGHLSEIKDLEEGVNYVSGEVLVESESLEEAEAFAAAYGGVLKSYENNIAVINLEEGISVNQALSAAAESRILLPVVWPNYYRYASDSSTEGIDMAEADYVEGASIYSDPFLDPSNVNYQWQHSELGSALAWNAGYTGQGVQVAVLDTGGGSDIQSSRNADIPFASLYVTTTCNNPTDFNGQGTHTAGLIGAKRNNGIGGAGMAPDASIHSVKAITNAGVGTDYAILSALKYAINKDRIRVEIDIINMSFGGEGYSGLYDYGVLDEARAKGIAVFAPAGDESTSGKYYPGAFDSVISVAATNQGGAKVYSSNYGPWVDLCGPGVDILSTLPKEKFDSRSSTLQATPIIAGAAAVILSAKLPEIENARPEDKVAALEKVLAASVVNASGTGIGKGIVNLPKALNISTSATAPIKPVFDNTASTYAASSIQVGITAEAGTEIYYSVDGKTPSIKEGKVKNAVLYEGPVSLEGSSKVTIKAISVNSWGKASVVASQTYQLKPEAAEIVITGAKKVVAGKSIVFSAKVFPENAVNKKITWSLSPTDKNTKISTSGKVSTKAGSAPGTYTVTATAPNKAEESYTFEIAAAANVKAIKFKNNTVKLNRGGSDTSYDLSSNLLVELKSGDFGSMDDITWTSNNPKVAVITQDNKLMTKGGGKAVITATAADGSKIKKSFTMQVTQFLDKIEVEGNDVLARGTSATMKALTFPGNAKSKAVTWSIAPMNAGVTINKNGKVSVSAAAEGEYVVTASAKVLLDNAVPVTGSKTIKVNKNAVSKLELVENSKNPAAVKSTTLLRVNGNKTKTGVSKEIKVKLTGGTAGEAAYDVFSSNPKAVSVSKSEENDNIITLQAVGNTAGTSTITVKSNDGTNKKVTCRVTVINPVSRVMISPEADRTRAVAIGKTLKLNATLEMGNGPISSETVTWKSSDERVVTVNNGIVTGKVEGWATITATATDGSGTYGTYDLFAMYPIEDLKLEGLQEGVVNTFTLNSSQSFMTLYNNKKSNAQQSYTGTDNALAVDVGNQDMLGVLNNQKIPVGQVKYRGIKLTFREKGSTTITLKAMDGSGYTKTYQIVVE